MILNQRQSFNSPLSLSVSVTRRNTTSAGAVGEIVDAIIISPLTDMSSPVITDVAGKITAEEYKAAIDAYIREKERQFELFILSKDKVYRDIEAEI